MIGELLGLGSGVGVGSGVVVGGVVVGVLALPPLLLPPPPPPPQLARAMPEIVQINTPPPLLGKSLYFQGDGWCLGALLRARRRGRPENALVLLNHLTWFRPPLVIVHFLQV